MRVTAVGKNIFLEILITPVTGTLPSIVLPFNSMTSGNWLQEHEALAAFIFVILSITLMGVFAWLERRFFQKKHR